MLRIFRKKEGQNEKLIRGIKEYEDAGGKRN
jgi:hypothetical protein